MEGIEDVLGHGARPIDARAKTGVAGDGQQPAAGVATTRSQLRRQHATQGPAGKPGIAWQAPVQLVEPGIGIGQLRQRFDHHLEIRRLLGQGLA